jgi:hypothetical protein
MRKRGPSFGDDSALAPALIGDAIRFQASGAALADKISPAQMGAVNAAMERAVGETALSLESQMILLATKCGRDQDYNKNFIIRFQPLLQANEREVLAYFRKLYGGAGAFAGEVGYTVFPAGDGPQVMTDLISAKGFVQETLRLLRSRQGTPTRQQLLGKAVHVRVVLAARDPQWRAAHAVDGNRLRAREQHLDQLPVRVEARETVVGFLGYGNHRPPTPGSARQPGG